MLCPSCGAENRDAARFCGTCGRSLSQAPRYEAATPPPSPEMPIEPPPPAPPAPAVAPVEADQPALTAQPDGSLSEEAQVEGAPPLSPEEMFDDDAARWLHSSTNRVFDEAASVQSNDPLARSDAGLSGPGVDGLPPAPAQSEDLSRQDEDEPGEERAASSAGWLPPHPTDATGEDENGPTVGRSVTGDAGSPGPKTDQVPPAITPPPPLDPGVEVAGRWRIIGLQETTEGRNTYSAVDMAACPVCSALFEPNDSFCSGCGVELKPGNGQAMLLHEAVSANALTAFGPGVTEHQGRLYVAAPALIVSDGQSAQGPRPLRLTHGYASHCGMVRDLDEDSLFVATLAAVFKSALTPSLGLYVVADGMGGHEGGELASQTAVERIAYLLMSVLVRFMQGDAEGARPGGQDSLETHIRDAVGEANTAVREMAQARGIDAGTTVTLALVVDGEAHIANVGDSRTFLFHDGRLRQLTQDHSLVASLVLAGALQPEEIYTHPQRNAVYRSLGTNERVEVDQFYEELQPGDALVLCCDGIWETVRPEGIEDVLLTVTDPQAACDELIRRGNLAGGDDNLSVIVVRASR